jgi:hypothetical protein
MQLKNKTKCFSRTMQKFEVGCDEKLGNICFLFGFWWENPCVFTFGIILETMFELRGHKWIWESALNIYAAFHEVRKNKLM